LLAVLIVILNAEVVSFFSGAGVKVPPVPVPKELITQIQTLSWFLPFNLFQFAFVEELAFRAFPLSTGFSLGLRVKGLMFIAIVSSVVFGYLHGGYTHIFIQGISGLIFCIIYLKCGCLEHKFFKPLFSATLAHASFNGMIILIPFLPKPI
jgi:membrane protease YdiL (CAAX protease family)